jgi:hypothetical protein
MTVIVSVGAVIACLSENRAIQYTPAARDERLQNPIPLDPVEVELDWQMLRAPQTNQAKRIIAVD